MKRCAHTQASVGMSLNKGLGFQVAEGEALERRKPRWGGLPEGWRQGVHSSA